jgi:hypothetical protein
VSVEATSAEREARAVHPGAPGTARSHRLRSALPLVLLWAAAGAILATITTRVRDWYAMPNELLNERRAISVAQSFSPLPTIHHQFVASFDQLYPLAIAPAFRYGTVLSDVRNAHALNAMLMTSACIPAFLLARRVGVGRPLAYLVAALCVCIPWMFFAALLMNEVVAYPVFVWAALAAQATIVSPGRRNDVLVLLVVVAAYFSRTQLVVLVAVLPVAVLAYELGRAGPGGRARAAAAAAGRHIVLVLAYGVGVAGALLLLALGRLHSVLGVYGETISGNSVSGGIPRSVLWHLAACTIGLGILPVVAGLAWLLANAVRPSQLPERHAFACFGATAAVLILVQVTVFDLRYVDGLVLDRYLIYLAPLLLLGFACALRDAKPLRVSLALVTAAVVAGFALGAIPTEPLQAVNSDAPIQTLYPPLVSASKSLTNARVLLAGATVLASIAFVVGRRMLSRRAFTVVFAVLPLLVIPSVTADLFARFFHDKGWSERAVTSSSGAQYSYVDQRVGRHAEVAIVPYPVSTDYPVTERVFRDYEFWNKSVDRDVQLSSPGVFEFTNDTFPKLHPTFDRRTGRASIAGWPYVIESTQETRARISGTVLAQSDVMLIKANRPWRADWISSGLYDDGWTKPGTEARVRVFAVPGARRAQSRWLTFGLRAPDDSHPRPVTIVSNVARTHALVGGTTSWTTVNICVPPGGFTDVRLAAPERSQIPGDLATLADYQTGKRIGGVFVSEISLSDDIGGSCAP